MDKKKPSPREVSLTELIKRITPQNTHTPKFDSLLEGERWSLSRP
jgi:hypothetical protein